MGSDARRMSGDLQTRLGSVKLPLSSEDAKELRTQVGAYATALRLDGMRPETALVEVKRMLRAAGLDQGWHLERAAASLEYDQFLNDVVTWCIDGYYSDGDGKA